MTTLPRLILAVVLALFLAPPARAADLPGYMVPPVEAPAPAKCAALGGGRQVDHVWQPPQVAYILATRCGGRWHLFSHATDLFVYYNGGSMDRTDIRVLTVP